MRLTIWPGLIGTANPKLHISQHTVQEQLTAAFDKLGVRSRRGLVATMLAGPPA